MSWLAHGVGGRSDLPLPFGWAVAGAAAAVVVSFVALGLLWHTPRLYGARAGRPVPGGLARLLDSRGLHVAAAAAGLLLTGYALLALVFGPDDADNPTPWVVYVVLWVGLVPASVLLGPVWRALNPVRTVHAVLNRAMRLDPREGLRPLPPAVGYWPAAAGLLAFTWMELVYPENTALATLQVAVGLYAATMLFLGLLYGSAVYDRGDALEAWSGLFGRMSVLGRRRRDEGGDGRWVLRSPLAGLDALAPAPGLVATVMVMVGSTAYDGASSSTRWVAFVQSQPLPRMLVGTLGLLAVIGLVSALYVACTAAAGILAGGPWRTMPGLFAHSVVPVALGYVVAHYYSLLVLEGQRAFIKLSDPLGTGADWLGTGNLVPSTAALDPTVVASIQVLAIIGGHVLGVVLAHDRAVRLFPRREAVLGQVPLLVLMVALTCSGLFLLFST